MITNPQIGMKVRCKGYFAQVNYIDGKIGTIINFGIAYPVIVKIDNKKYGFRYDELDLVPYSPEEQSRLDEQQRRQEHADKYL